MTLIEPNYVFGEKELPCVNGTYLIIALRMTKRIYPSIYLSIYLSIYFFEV